MKLADLSPTILEKIQTLRYDCILEKQEGPEWFILENEGLMRSR